MTTSIVERHQEYLKQFIAKIQDSRNQALRAVMAKINKPAFSVKAVNKHYQQFKDKGINVSYIRAIRSYLESHFGLSYDESILVIIEVFRPLFEEGYSYTDFIYRFNRDKKLDEVNARAEWRAYFEFRFFYELTEYLKHSYTKYWLSINFNLYSFINDTNVPRYRFHCNVPSKADLIEANGDSPYDIRERSFRFLEQFQHSYSTVWEVIHNSLTSIFYFDKTADSISDMVVYEIDPDVKPKTGENKAHYISRLTIDGNHRKKPILADRSESSVGEIFKNERRQTEKYDDPEYGKKERAFQYSIIRFLIRSGIFNPMDGAYAENKEEHKFKNLLREAYDLFLNNKFVDEQSVYSQKLIQELGKLDFKQLTTTIDQQFRSSAQRQPIEAEPGKWINFDHSEKYTAEENKALDRVIALFDLVHPTVLDVRLGIFEAGFYHLTQEENTISHIYWIPVIINWKERYVGGTVYVNSDKRFSSARDWKITYQNNKYEDGSNTSNPLIEAGDIVPRDVLNLMQHFNGLFGDKISGEVEETLRPAQERAAAVSIMSRNISHNIGSHVLSYLKNMLSDEQDMLREGVFDKILELSGEKLGWHESLRANNPVFISPYLRSLGRIIGYFQERQDFIGTFASDRNLFFSPILFWEDIISNFYGEREFSSEQKGILGKTKNLALDFIVFSEEYQEKDMLIESYFIDKTNPKLAIAINKQNDIRLALPAGSTGRQGMYTILENLIRNTAKHGVAKSKRKGHKINVRITLRELADDNTLYQVEILDNSGMVSDTSLELIQNALTRSLVGKDGNPNEQHKGIKEIQIAAGWLRGILPHELNAKEGDKTELLARFPVLTASRGIHPKTKENGLQYTFYLRRTKFALLIVKNDPENPDKYEQLFKTHKLLDWDVITFDAQNDGNFNPPQIYYQFILVHEDLAPAGEKVHRTILKKCSVRVMAGWKDDYFEYTSLKGKPDFFDLQSLIYAMWLDYPLDRKQPNQLSQFNLVLHPHQKNWSISGLNAESTENQLKIGIGSRHIESGENQISDLLEIMPSGIPNQYILFGSHLDLNIHYDELKKRRRSSLNKDIFLFKDYLYIEGISGGNSTDRLLHREKKDHWWWCKMMETALTKVIIIDERTWKNYRGGSLEDIERNYDRLRKKNIHVLTLEYRNDEHLHLLDLRDQTVALLDEQGNARFIDEVAKSLYQESHFITLHQGLLERALKHCEKGVAQLGDEQSQVNFLLEQFRKNLMQAKFRLCIHSGRSKTHVLPEHTAFIQLSALESALQDCKSTLCELFYSSIQEK